LKNYLSSFDFESYILFVGGVVDTFRRDKNIDIFGIENVAEKAKKSLLEGLKEEANKKNYTRDFDISDETLNSINRRCLSWVVVEKTYPIWYNL